MAPRVVQFIFTGETELVAFVPSLERALGTTAREVEFRQPLRVNGTTTARLPIGSAVAVATMKKLARKMLAAATIQKKRVRLPDLVIALDDLELANLDQANVVLDHLRLAVEEVIREKSVSDQPAARQAFANKCSFHLLCPMIESYFFGDRLALAQVGIPTDFTLDLCDTDVERFETEESEAWSRLVDSRNKEKSAQGWSWWNEARHPKHYIDFLSRDVNPEFAYVETTHGVAALRGLNWREVFETGGPACFARSLFEDLLWGLDLAPPSFPSSSGDLPTDPYRRGWTIGSGVLRNL